VSNPFITQVLRAVQAEAADTESRMFKAATTLETVHLALEDYGIDEEHMPGLGGVIQMVERVQNLIGREKVNAADTVKTLDAALSQGGGDA
jgi:hypothetical protein